MLGKLTLPKLTGYNMFNLLSVLYSKGTRLDKPTFV